MRPKSILLLVLALGCGLVAAIGINQVLANRTVQQAGDPTDMVPIFVALTDIGLGDPLTPEVLKLEEWPKTKAPTGALTKLEDIEGRRARAKFYGGEPIIEAKLLAKGDQGSGATDLIPKGFRVVSVKVDDVSGSGLILPGDRVDVLVHLQDSPGREVDKTSTRTFLHNIKVFAVNDVFSRESNGETAITAKTISLLVTPQQAEMVTMANEMGKIRLVMRSADDETNDETTGVTPSELFHSMAPAASALAKPAAAPARPSLDSSAGLLRLLNQPRPAEPASLAPSAPKNAWKMVLIEGNAVREVEFADGSRIGSPTSSRQLSGPSNPAQPAFGPQTTAPPPPPPPDQPSEPDNGPNPDDPTRDT
ncbi:MAG: Flp pilus assembly protein CpaB [Planctomycetia bacterium]|nr:Flp pilus assembly protein CpaB [Planctomycetia bacterium]